ncbi:MAG: aldehyde ferredoxin oxidoreductase C-terminal domain-containing protein [Candidatus Bathyarchaeia archaeon]
MIFYIYSLRVIPSFRRKHPDKHPHYREKLLAIGDRVFTMKRAYIAKIGISRKDDRLPDRCMEVPRVVEGVELLADVDSLLPSYYALRDWDENGIPTAEKLKQLGIRPL